jgi:hypothetical protein
MPEPDANEQIRARLGKLADGRRFLDYHRLHYRLRRERFLINHKRSKGLYQNENLCCGSGDDTIWLQILAMSHKKQSGEIQCRAMDDLSNNHFNGRKFRVLT